MTKETYLKQLEEQLKDIDPKEREEALAYCKEYFEDAKDKTMDQIIEELGTPEEFSRHLQKDTSFKKKITPPEFKYKTNQESNEGPQKKKKSKALFIIVGVLISLFVLVFVIKLALGVYGTYLVHTTLGISVQEDVQNDLAAPEYTYSDLHHIEIETNCSVIVKKGSADKIYFNSLYADEVYVENKNNEIEIKAMTNRADRDKQIVVEYVDEIRNLDIECENGNITVENVSGNKIDLSTENGNIDFDVLDCNVVSLDANNGNISGTLAGNFSDYKYEVENKNGNTNMADITSDSFIETEGNWQGQRKLDIECENGNIDVGFTG